MKFIKNLLLYIVTLAALSGVVYVMVDKPVVVEQR